MTSPGSQSMTSPRRSPPLVMQDNVAHMPVARSILKMNARACSAGSPSIHLTSISCHGCNIPLQHYLDKSSLLARIRHFEFGVIRTIFAVTCSWLETKPKFKMAVYNEQISEIFRDYSPDFVPKPQQEEVLEALWNAPQKDLIVSWPTGSGKSVISHLAGRVLAARRPGATATDPKHITVLVVPLNLIQKDQMESLQKRGIKACKLDIGGGASTAAAGQEAEEYDRESDGSSSDEDRMETEKVVETEATFSDICNGLFEVVIAHPEALLCTAFGDRLLKNQNFCRRVNCLVIDECHTIEQWGKTFRTAYSQLDTLVGHFECPIIALSATITKGLLKTLPDCLGMRDPQIFRESPDVPNIYYEKIHKPSNYQVGEAAAFVYEREINRLKEEGEAYPVTLSYMPLRYAAWTQAYCLEVFGEPRLGKDRYGLLFSLQDEEVREYISAQLKLNNPHLRLVVCSSTIGMGFDNPCIQRVIHAQPPYNMIDLVQQVGRAGRSGQEARSTIYWNGQDISAAIDDVTDDIQNLMKKSGCIRARILDCFGFEKKEELFESPCKCCSDCKKQCKCPLH